MTETGYENYCNENQLARGQKISNFQAIRNSKPRALNLNLPRSMFTEREGGNVLYVHIGVVTDKWIGRKSRLPSTQMDNHEVLVQSLRAARGLYSQFIPVTSSILLCK